MASVKWDGRCGIALGAEKPAGKERSADMDAEETPAVMGAEAEIDPGTIEAELDEEIAGEEVDKVTGTVAGFNPDVTIAQGTAAQRRWWQRKLRRRRKP
jgi:hypothetical protein